MILIFERAGRLWRHKRGPRPISEPCLLVAGLTGDEPPSFGKPLWWDCVYREDLLLRTWCLLRDKRKIMLPDEIDKLVQAVYEEEVEIPDFLRDRLAKCKRMGEGEAYAHKIEAQ